MIGDLQTLLNKFKKNTSATEADLEIIRKAFNFSQRAHRGQKRKSGEQFFNHAFETAVKVAEWRLDAQTIAAALLHDVVEETKTTVEDIAKEFGEETAFLVDGVTKIGHLKYRGKESDAENMRKMFLALGKDIRVVLIRLADRLHNMKTLSALPSVKQKRIAMETSEIYAPLAYRLGMQSLAGELEDLSFPYTNPSEYKWLVENVKEKYEERERYLDKVKKIIEKTLKENNIEPITIDFRAKRYSSLYKKLLHYDMNLEQIHDLVAMRIILKDVESCYAVLGIIHQLWPPMPGRIKDYIALPKPNGYQSIHTTVFCIDNKPTEFQIRTLQMHEEAENGIAAHWAYEQIKGTKHYRENRPVFADKKELAWVEQLRKWQKEFPGSEEFLDSLKIDFFKDRIFVITPKGEVRDLPAGSTPVDFAYQIHTKIGDECSGAKVNNKIVPLDYVLQAGDVVEILTQKSKKPSESWLSFVKTEAAKKKIKSAIHAASRRNTEIKPGQTEYKIIFDSRIGLLKDVSAVVSQNHIHIISVNYSRPTPNTPTTVLPFIKIRCELGSRKKAEELMFKIKKVKGVREISYKII